VELGGEDRLVELEPAFRAALLARGREIAPGEVDEQGQDGDADVDQRASRGALLEPLDGLAELVGQDVGLQRLAFFRLHAGPPWRLTLRTPSMNWMIGRRRRVVNCRLPLTPPAALLFSRDACGALCPALRKRRG